MKKRILLIILLIIFGCASTKNSSDTPDKCKNICQELHALKSKSDSFVSDMDKDGVSDIFDKDNSTSAGSKVYGDGTSVDTDGDGVLDEQDGDPFSKKAVKVDANGTEIDTDADGVPDSQDMEPNTAKGLIVNFQGLSIKEAVGSAIIGNSDYIVESEKVQSMINHQLNQKGISLLDEQLFARVNHLILDSIQKIRSLEIDSLNNAFLNGTYYLKADSSMKCFISNPVEVGIIDANISIVLRSKVLNDQLPEGAILDQIKVDSVMSAELKDASGTNTDPAFEITPNTSDSLKIIGNYKFTNWYWVVKPLKVGKHKLQLVIKIRKSYQGIAYVDEVVVNKQISVSSNNPALIGKFFNDEWKWLSTTIFLPIITWYFKRREKLLEAKIDSIREGKT